MSAYRMTEVTGRSLWARVNEPSYDIKAFVAERVCWLLAGAALMLVFFTATLDKPKIIRNGCTQTVNADTIVLVCERGKE